MQLLRGYDLRIQAIEGGLVTEDLSRHQIELYNNLILTLYSEDIEVEGAVQFSDFEKIWVAKIDWDAIRSVEENVNID